MLTLRLLTKKAEAWAGPVMPAPYHHLWQRQGKCEAARELLAPIYGWFTEGLDTADLQEAKGLLKALF